MRTRFAPSPTGLLHLGHAYSALLAYDMARIADGEFVLRIEDTDTTRCKPEYETAILDDLHWLGLTWPSPPMRQSDRLSHYDRSLSQLIDAGYCYPCSCSRRDIRQAIAAPHRTATLYPGTCRHRPMSSRTDTDVVRLNMARVIEKYPDIIGLTFTETGPANPGIHTLTKTHLMAKIGDIVLVRRDIRTAAYHLAVVVDDAAQNITDIIRGQDLFHATFIHRLLQALLQLPTPTYHHHHLITDADGQRLAKRTDARSIRTLRENGMTPSGFRSLFDF